MPRLKTAILISGRGSNLQALIDACTDPAFPAEIVGVISNRPNAPGLEHARAAGIATAVVDHKAYADRPAFEAALDTVLKEARAELICNAGFMRILTAGFVERWRDRCLNIHPSLLPAFPGLDTHARALAAGVRFAGCTVHFIRAAVDAGPIIVQAAVPVLPDDDVASLAVRVLTEERRIYPQALRMVAEGRVRVVDGRAVIDGAAAPPAVLINPSPAGSSS